MATFRQLEYIESLIDRLSIHSCLEEELRSINVIKLTVKEASKLIGRLQEEVYEEDHEGWDGHKQ